MTAPPSLTVARYPGDAVLVGGNVLTPSRDLYWTVTMTDMDAHPYSSTLLPFQPHSPEPGHPPPTPCQGWVGGALSKTCSRFWTCTGYCSLL